MRTVPSNAALGRPRVGIAGSMNVFLPCLQPDRSREMPRSPAPPLGPHTRTPASKAPLEVLVVDADPSVRRGLRAAVTAMGHRPRVAASAEEALATHRDRHADVIVSDRRLADRDGLELCRRVRDSDAGTYTVLLLTGATADKHELLAAVRAGADDLLRKPLDTDELEARLIAASRGLQAFRAIAAHNVDLRRDSQVLFRTARVDPLTHVANRLRLDEDLDTLEGQVARYGRRASIAMCDLDSFKLYNDRYGHLAGDEALRRIARTIRANVRRGDHVYRYGGEEFLVILQEQGPDEAAAAMERVRTAVEELGIAHAPGAKHATLTVSVGVASIGGQTSGSSVLDAVDGADRALYRVKASGGNGLAIESDRSAA